MEPIVQYLIAPAVLLILGGVGWLFKSIFNLFAENQKEARTAQYEATAAFIAFLTKLTEESNRERTIREEAYYSERSRWLDRLDFNNVTITEHTEFSKQQTHALEAQAKAIEHLAAGMVAVNGTLGEMKVIMQEIKEHGHVQ